MTYGLPYSKGFIHDLSDKEIRDEFVADQIRTRIALLVRTLREQPERDWSQAELGKEMRKPQNVISRLEDPDYGKMTLQTLLDVAAAFNLPLWIDMPEWGDWLKKIRDVPAKGFKRTSFDADRLIQQTVVAQLRPTLPPNLVFAADCDRVRYKIQVADSSEVRRVA
jgi:hypothetical protein